VPFPISPQKHRSNFLGAGVYAPHSSWRKSVVPEHFGCNEQVDSNVGACSGGTCLASDAATAPPSAQPEASGSKDAPSAVTSSGATGDGSVALLPATSGGRGDADAEPSAAFTRHCAPFALRFPSARADWAELLKRVHNVNALACPCGGRLRFIALITESETARAILESLSLPSEPPPIARARSPDFDWV
jgi:hypothetical protein